MENESGLIAFYGAETSTKQPTTQLRFRGGMLEQLWQIAHYRGGIISRIETEWRLVETVPLDNVPPPK